MLLGVARGEAMVATLEVGLPDEVDHVIVVERVHHVLEESRPNPDRFTRGQGRDGCEDELVRPVVVAREHARGLCGHHGQSSTSKRFHCSFGRLLPSQPIWSMSQKNCRRWPSGSSKSKV